MSQGIEGQAGRTRRWVIPVVLAVVIVAVTVPPLMGRWSYKQHEYSRAAYWYRIAHSMVPCQWTTEALGAALWRAQDIEGPRLLSELFSRGSRLRYGSYVMLAEYYGGTGQAEQLSKLADEVERHYPGSAARYICRGLRAEVLWDMDTAAREFSSAWTVEIQAPRPDHYLLRGVAEELAWIYLGLERYVDAHNSVTLWMALRPQDYSLLDFAAISSEGMGKYEQAADENMEAVEHGDAPLDYLYGMCLVNGRVGRAEEARTLLAKYRSELPDVEYAFCNAALVIRDHEAEAVDIVRYWARRADQPEHRPWAALMAAACDTWGGPNRVAAQQLARMKSDNWILEAYRQIYLAQARGKMSDEQRTYLQKVHQYMSHERCPWPAMDVREALNGGRVKLPRGLWFRPVEK